MKIAVTAQNCGKNSMRYLWTVRTAARLVFMSKHELTHVLLGLVYAWFLREWWGEFSVRQIWWAVFASLLPDVDHLIFFFFYGRNDPYSRQVKKLLRDGQVSSLFSYVMKGHKHNTNLWSHNIYIVFILLFVSFLSYQFDWKLGLVLFGAMALHFIFDIVDDFLILHGLNPNWRRWGLSKRAEQGLQ